LHFWNKGVTELQNKERKNGNTYVREDGVFVSEGTGFKIDFAERVRDFVLGEILRKSSDPES
jgi:hypothetical protein